MDLAEARAFAHRLLADDQPQRWRHVQGVATRAELFVDTVPDWDTLASAAYLHDIGYAKAVVDIGFHQIDGARHLRRLGWDEAVVNLVAHHSGAQIRAELAGLGAIYAAEFVRDETLPHRQLHFCDMTVAMDGSPVTVQERLAGMRHRHRDNLVMMQFLDGHEQAIVDMVARTWASLGGDGGNRAGQPVSAT